MRISDWSSDVCSSDLARRPARLVDETREDIDQRRLARAVRAEQTENLAARHVETDIVERLLAAGIEFRDGVDADGGFTNGRLHSRAPARVQAIIEIRRASFREQV